MSVVACHSAWQSTLRRELVELPERNMTKLLHDRTSDPNRQRCHGISQRPYSPLSSLSTPSLVFDGYLATHRCRGIGEEAELGVILQCPHHRVLHLGVPQLHATIHMVKRCCTS